MAPEETTNETNATAAVTEAEKPVENAGETDVDPFEGATKGIKDRLKRLEKQLMTKKVQPLEQRVQELEALLQQQGTEVPERPAESTQEKVEEDTKSEGPTQEQILDYLRTKAAFEAQLPAEALVFLTETTEEKLKLQAEALKALPWKGRRLASPIRPDSGGTAPQQFRRSQLRDAAFFAANRDAIMAAIAEGRLIDDTRG